MAAVLACGTDAVLSHGAAAVHWGLLRPLDGPIDVTVPHHNGRRRRNGIRIHRCASLGARLSTSGSPKRPAPLATVRERIPVTTVPRTLVDIRDTLPPRLVRRAVRQAEFLGLGLGEIKTDRTRSDLERDFLRLWRRKRLPQPEVNVPIDGMTVDFLWRERAARRRNRQLRDPWRDGGVRGRPRARSAPAAPRLLGPSLQRKAAGTGTGGGGRGRGQGVASRVACRRSSFRVPAWVMEAIAAGRSSAEASSPTIRCSGLSASAQRFAISPTTLPAEALGVEAALAADDGVGRGAGGGRSRRRRGRRRRPDASRAPWAQRPPESPPAQPLIGTPRGSRGSSAAQRVEPRASAARPPPGSAPFCGAKSRAASSKGTVTSQSTSIRATSPRSVARSPQRLDRAAATVGGGAAADGDEHRPRARLERRRRSARRSRRCRPAPGPAPPARPASGPRPARSRPPPSRRRPSSAKLASIGRRSGSWTARLPPLAAERREQHLHRPFAAVGDGAAIRLRSRLPRPRPRSPRRPSPAPKVPLKESGATRKSHAAAS